MGMSRKSTGKELEQWQRSLLKDRREARGLTLKQLTAITKISEKTIRNIEKGSTNPRGDILGNLLEELKIPREDFFEGGQKSSSDEASRPLVFKDADVTDLCLPNKPKNRLEDENFLKDCQVREGVREAKLTFHEKEVLVAAGDIIGVSRLNEYLVDCAASPEARKQIEAWFKVIMQRERLFLELSAGELNAFCEKLFRTRSMQIAQPLYFGATYLLLQNGNRSPIIHYLRSLLMSNVNYRARINYVINTASDEELVSKLCRTYLFAHKIVDSWAEEELPLIILRSFGAPLIAKSVEDYQKLSGALTQQRPEDFCIAFAWNWILCPDFRYPSLNRAQPRLGIIADYFNKTVQVVHGLSEPLESQFQISQISERRKRRVSPIADNHMIEDRDS